MLAGSGERSRHTDQAKNFCNAHQLLGIRRSVEVKACLFSNQEDSFPVGDQWSCTVSMRAIRFSTLQRKQLESERMCLLRRAFAREAYSHTDKLRTLSDSTLRRRLNFPTLESVTRERILKWYQSMLARPSHHTIYLGDFFLPGQASFGVGYQHFWSTISKASQGVTASQGRCRLPRV